MNFSRHWALTRQIGRIHRKPDRKGRSATQHAFDTDVAAQQAREATRDCEAEARTSLHRVAARARVDLFEFIEDSCPGRSRAIPTPVSTT